MRVWEQLSDRSTKSLEWKVNNKKSINGKSVNMRHIHTSIVHRHLATRSNNTILRPPSPHICSSEDILPRLIGSTLAQHRTNKSLFLKSYLHKVDAKSHASPLCPLCNTDFGHISARLKMYFVFNGIILLKKIIQKKTY